jgi:MFS family permease
LHLDAFLTTFGVVSVEGLSTDTRRILTAQGLRAFAYGLGAVLLGATLERRGFSSRQVGLLLGAVLAGTVVASVVVGRFGDRFGRRRCYLALYLILGLTGVAFALSDELWLLVVVALGGALSTEVVESGPFTSLEQAMLATDLSGRARLRGFGTYNAVATAAGSLGALAAGGLGPLRNVWTGGPTDERAFLVFVPMAVAGAALALRLTPAVEAGQSATPGLGTPLGPSRPQIRRLATLFAADSFGGGFVVQSFIAYWLTVRFDASVGLLGVVFFAVGTLQTASMLVAPRLAERFGLLPTMVFTHLPSNVALAAMAFAPNLGMAVALLVARVTLSQMDVPTRQAYVMALVDPAERTAAAVWTNTARAVVRPAGPALAGASQAIALGAPFLIAGVIKGAYDLALWRWFRRVELPEEVGATQWRREVGQGPPPTSR